MYEVVTERPVLFNPDIGFSSLMAMSRALERNSEQQQFKDTEKIHGIKEEPRDMNVTSFFTQADNVGLTFPARQNAASRTAKSPSNAVSTRTSPVGGGNREENTKATNKRKTEHISPLDLSVKKPRVDFIVECTEKPVIKQQSKSQEHKPRSIGNITPPVAANQKLPQIFGTEHSVATDYAETKPSSDHMFMKFKLDKLDVNVIEKPKFTHGKYKTYLAAHHQKTTRANDSKPLSKINEPIKTQLEMTRDWRQPIKGSDVKRMHSEPNTINIGPEGKHDVRHVHSLPVHTGAQGKSSSGAGEKSFQRIFTSGPHHMAEEISEQIRSFTSRMNKEEINFHSKNGYFRQSPPLHHQAQNTYKVSDNRTPTLSKFNLGTITKLSLEQFLDQLRSTKPSVTITKSRSPQKPTHFKDSRPTNSPSSNLNGLGDWAAVDTGYYPAFGKVPHLKVQNKLLRVQSEAGTKLYDEKYVSEHTASLLHKAEKPAVSANKSTTLHCLASADVKHRCPGCCKRVISTPELISEIWRFRKMNRYTTPNTTNSASVVFCCQLQSRPTKDPPSSVVTSCSDDVMDANKQLKDHGTLTTTSCKHPARSDMLANNEMIVISKDATAENPKIEEDSESEDDLLANFIEYSSDEDEEVIKDNRKSHYLVATKSLSFVPSLPSAHQNPSKSFVDNILKNASLLYSDRKVLNVHSLAPDSEQEFNVSDLEISDDDDDVRSV